MKRKKLQKTVSITMSMLLMAYALPLSAAAAEDSVTAINSGITTINTGDVTENGNSDITDIVSLQKYLLGENTLTKQQFLNSDINLDGRVNGLDLSNLKTNVLQEQPVMERTQVIDVLSYQSNFWKVAHESPSTVITSVEELEEYLTPIVDASSLSRYIETYTEAFFSDNVLCLCAIAQSCGGIQYQIDSVAYEGNTLKISYSDDSEPFKSYPTIVFDVLAQVTIPKAMFHADSVVWEKQVSELLTPTFNGDEIRAVTEAGWETALSANSEMILQSEADLDEYLAPLFQDAVIRSLKSTYDAAFFAENMLFVNLIASPPSNDYTYMVNDATYNDKGQLQFTYERIYCNCLHDAAVTLAQVAIPKSQYNGLTPVWVEKDATDVNGSFSSRDVTSLEEITEKNLVKDYGSDSDKGTWVYSQAELDDYLSAYLTEEGIAFFQYPEDYFDTNAIYVCANSNIIGTTKNAWKIQKYEADSSYKAIRVGVSVNQPVSCMGGMFVDTLSVPLEDAENAAVVFENYHLESLNNMWGNDDLLLFSEPNSIRALAVHQYSFREESEVAFYMAYPSGMMQYGELQPMDSYALTDGFMPFDSDYTTTTDADGNTIYTGKNFSMTWTTESVIVQFQTSADAESMETYEIPRSDLM